MKDFFLQILFFSLFASFILHPVFRGFDRIIPGAEVSDVWNALWSLGFIHDSMLNGQLPNCTKMLNHPDGGCLWPTDILGGIVTAPFTFFLPLSERYIMLVFVQLMIVGLGTASLLGEIDSRTSIVQRVVAGFVVMDSTVMRVAIHNGSSEALSIGWVILALWGFLRFRKGDTWGYALVLISILSSWYGVAVVLGFLLLSFLFDNKHRRRTAIGVLLYLAVLLPYAFFALSMSTGDENLLQIKGVEELRMVRRTIGAMDPFSYVLPAPYISPDFSLISRYGEQFIHSGYLGWVLILFAMRGGYRLEDKSSVRSLMILGVSFFLLSLGPVLILEGEPIVFGDRGVPLPYFLVEDVWGFSQLSLLFRWSFVPLVVLTILSSIGNSKRVTLLLGLLIFLENRLFSPGQAVPAFSEIAEDDGLLLLQDAPEGGVGILPIAGGRENLYWQTIHQKPVFSGLNFSANTVFLGFLDAIADTHNDLDFRSLVETEAERFGVRYLLIYQDPVIMPDQYTQLTIALKDSFPSLSVVSGQYCILRLY